MVIVYGTGAGKIKITPFPTVVVPPGSPSTPGLPSGTIWSRSGLNPTGQCMSYTERSGNTFTLVHYPNAIIDYNLVINYAFTLFDAKLVDSKYAIRDYINNNTSLIVNSINDLVSPANIAMHVDDYDLRSAELFASFKAKVAMQTVDSWAFSQAIVDMYTTSLTDASTEWQWFIEGFGRDVWPVSGCGRGYANVSDPNGQSKIDTAVARRQSGIDDFSTYIGSLLSPSISAVVDALNSASDKMVAYRLSNFKSTVDSAKSAYLESIHVLIDDQVLLDIDDKLSQANSVIDGVLSKIDSYIDSLMVSLGFIDSSDFRSKLSDIRKGASVILNTEVSSAYKVFGGVTDTWFTGDPALFNSKLSEISTTLNSKLSVLVSYSADFNTYVTDSFVGTDEFVKSKVESVNSSIELSNDLLRDKVVQVRLDASNKINDYINDRAIIRLTGIYVIPVLNWTGVNKFGVQVTNVGNQSISMWFGWRFIDDKNKSYIYNQTPSSIPIINPGDVVMIESEISFVQLFPTGSPGKLRARLIPNRSGA